MNEHFTSEEYTIVESSEAKNRRCPFPFQEESGATRAYCDGLYCMAWICEVDEKDEPTGRGRCGMVQAFVPRFATCAVPFESENTPEKSDE